MNKTMLFSGLIIFAMEFLAMIVYGLVSIEYNWDLILKVSIFSIGALLNIAAAIFVIVGALIK